MADVDDTLPEWSSTTASNKPTGATTVGTGWDDNLREIQGVITRWLSSKGADIASSTTTDLGAVEGLMHDITGTTTITGFGTIRAGIWKIIKFEGALTLTHNGTSLILPGAANITTADGDIATFISEGSGNWRCVSYVPAGKTGSGSAVYAASPTFTGTINAAALTLSSTLTLSGTAANIALGSNYISNGGTDAGFSLDASNNATLSGALAITGALTGVTTLAASSTGTFGGNLIFSADNRYLLANTSDGSDTYQLGIGGGGSASVNRGALILVSGNEHASTGAAEYYAGNVAGGNHNFYVNSSALEFKVSQTAGGTRSVTGIRIGADSTNNLLDDASNGAGTATLYIGNASINVTSDERIKTNVRLWNGDASAILNALPVKAWDAYTESAPMGGYEGGYVGFTAQDMHKVAPWSVNTQGDTGLPWQARYEFLNGIIVRGMQQIMERLDKLEERKLK